MRQFVIISLAGVLSISSFAKGNPKIFTSNFQKSFQNIRKTCVDGLHFKGASTKADSVEKFLDCFVQFESDGDLPRLGLQWILLRKSGWKIISAPSNVVPREGFNFRFSKKHPHNSSTKHELFLDLPNLNAIDDIKFLNWLSFLEEVFANILEAEMDEELDYRPSLETFRANFNRYSNLVAKETPLRRQRFFYPEISGPFLGGDGRLSFNFKKYHSLSKKESGLPLKVSPLKSLTWSDLLFKFRDLKPKRTSCYEVMEGRVVRATMMMLERPQFFDAVFEERNQVYGVYGENEGIWGKLPPVNLSRSLHRNKNFLNGLSLIFAAYDKSSLDNDFYTGMNGIIQGVTDAAAEDLDLLGGFGAWTKYRKEYEGNFEPYSFFDRIHGLSAEMLKYWIFRQQMEKKLKAEMHLDSNFLDNPLKASEKKKWKKIQRLSKFEAREEFLNRPAFEEIYFEPGVFMRMTFADWIEKLYEANPRTPYQIWSYGFISQSFYEGLLNSLLGFSTLREFVEEEKLLKPTKWRRKARSIEGPSFVETRNRFLDVFQ